MANKGRSRKEMFEVVYSDDGWVVRTGRLKPKKGRPHKTSHLFEVVAEKLPEAGEGYPPSHPQFPRRRPKPFGNSTIPPCGVIAASPCPAPQSRPYKDNPALIDREIPALKLVNPKEMPGSRPNFRPMRGLACIGHGPAALSACLDMVRRGGPVV